MEVNLSNNKLVAPGLGQLRVEAWVDGAMQGQMRNYQWRCRVSVPGGGLIERADPSAFEAPIEGYKPTLIWLS